MHIRVANGELHVRCALGEVDSQEAAELALLGHGELDISARCSIANALNIQTIHVQAEVLGPGLQHLSSHVDVTLEHLALKVDLQRNVNVADNSLVKVGIRMDIGVTHLEKIFCLPVF